jgi:hypothetical protein
MTMPDHEPQRAASADIERRRKSVWAAARRYQMSVDAYRAAGQPPPPPRPELAGLVRVTPSGTVEPIDPNLDITAPLTRA